MNKKLFFAGFALLAAVSFTSCNSDNPIDITNPNGVTPAASTHYVGGSYDWTAVAKDYAELQKFWDADKAAVKEAIKDKKTINILLDVSGYTLEADAAKAFDLPNFWQTVGAPAGKVVNITFQGNFKNADYKRAAQIAGGTIKNFPVQIITDKLAGAEVNFTFNVEKFDLDLKTTLARSTFAGEYAMGYLDARSAENLSAIVVKGGTVEGVDHNIKTTGDIIAEGGSILGAWTRDGVEPLKENKKGMKLGKNGKTIVTDLYVEANTTLANNVKVGNDITKYNNIYIVAKNVTLTMNQENYAAKVVGVDASDVVSINSAKDLDNVEAFEKVTIKGFDVTIAKDKFTDVAFDNGVTFATDKLNTLEKVTFNGALNIEVPADDQTLTFNGVTFAGATQPAIKSTKKIDNTVAYTTYVLYQWVVDATSPANGAWVIYNVNGTKIADILTYNAGTEPVEYADTDADVNGVGQLVAKPGKSPDLSQAKTLIKITHYNAAGTVVLTPNNFNIIMDKDCKFDATAIIAGAAAVPGVTTDAALNYIWGNKNAANAQELSWYGITYNEIPYAWVPSLTPGGAFAQYILVKNQ